ncbi:MAG TPA: serine/threonine-protein kinase [Polyangiaceae bacterium]|nr:serine/threonine-protein kinase [Polyangiaceae bacterium]
MLNLSLPPEPPHAQSAAPDGEPVQESGLARVGRTIKGKWRLDAILGSGGTATVYAATHRNGNRVAVKVLHQHFSTMPVERERFTREGYFANKVDHPDVVRVLDEDVDEEGNPFLVMELLDGEPLVARWKAAGYRLPPPEALWIADRLLAVLEAAHACGVVHRDVKPENLFLTAAGGLKVLDFGIARMGGVGSGTVRGIVLGTPGFTAPEQARGEWEIVGARTDIWAVGATLYALLTGRLVHEEQQTAAHLLRVSMEPVPPVRAIDPSVPDAVARLIDRALAFMPEQRFASAAEMRQAIAAAYRLTMGCNLSAKRPIGESTVASSTPTLRVTTGTTVITRRAKTPRRAAWLDRWDAAAVATAFFALGGIAVGYFASDRDSSAAAPVEEATLVAPPTALVSPPAPTASAIEPSHAAPAQAEPAPLENAAAPLPLVEADLSPAAIVPMPPAVVVPKPKSAAPSAPPPATVRAPARPLTHGQGGDARAAAPPPVIALPPSALPGSTPKRPPRASSGDNFDFVETRR